MTLLINFFAGAGAGKTSLALGIASELKWAGANVEYVPEYVKAMAWEERPMVFKDQLYILGKQNYVIKRLIDKVDVIVTDSPIVLSAYYNQPYDEHFNQLIFDVFKQYNSLNFFVERIKKFNPLGRFQSLSEAQQDDINIKEMLIKNNIPINLVKGERESIPFILELIDIVRNN